MNLNKSSCRWMLGAVEPCDFKLKFPSLKDIGAIASKLPLYCVTVRALSDELAAVPISQYLLLQRIPAHLLKTLEEDPEVLKGVLATVLRKENAILYKIMPL